MSLQCPSTSFNTLFSFLPKAIEALVYKLCKKKKKKKGNVFLYISTERRLPEIFIIRKCAINRRCIIIGKGIQTFYWSYFFIFFFWNIYTGIYVGFRIFQIRRQFFTGVTNFQNFTPIVSSRATRFSFRIFKIFDWLERTSETNVSISTRPRTV